MREWIGRVAIVFALLAQGALAQEPAPEDPPEEPVEIRALPLESVSDRAESLAAELRLMTPSEESQAELKVVEAELEGLADDIASRVEGAESALAFGPSVRRLQDLEQQLLALQEKLALSDGELDREVGELGVALQSLETSAEIWEKTEAEARAAATSQPTQQRIASTRSEINRVREELTSRRNEILAVRDATVDPARSLNRTLDSMHAELESRIHGLFVLDRPPIWSPILRASILDELGGGWPEPLTQRMERLGNYIRERQLLIAFQLVLFFALTLGLRSLGTRAKQRVEEGYDIRDAELVFRHPAAMALLIVLGSTPQFHPMAPNLFRQLAFVSAIFPAAVIAYRLLPAAVVPLVVVIPIYFLTDRLRDIIETLPAIERVVFLVELMAALGFALWLLRPKRVARIPAEMLREQFFRAAGSIVRAAAGLLALAIFAEGVGLGNLSELVGNGALRASYATLFFFALYKVTQSLVAYALLLRPLRLLRFVSRNLRLVRRRADFGLQALAVLAWIYFLLSIFQLLGPAESAIGGLLGASLGVGSLSLSLGKVVVFALTIWLSFGLARFVNFVLLEDVFPRMKVPRGVPYAVSNLLRYMVVFIGFMIALAAAGITLSNLTVIAGGLGVGIGFGLQSVVNNFVSGLILLFERPLNVGDVVQLQSQNLWGEIKHIGIRASVIRTWEGAEVIVPNGNLISDAVTNWTLSDQRRRIELDVGVEYGTDAQRVIDLLLEVAGNNTHLLTTPEPVALFLGFGDSSLNFRLRAWIDSFHEGFTVSSDLAIAIQRALADANITIPFPQRDLHLRTVSPEAASGMDMPRVAPARGSSDDEA